MARGLPAARDMAAGRGGGGGGSATTGAGERHRRDNKARQQGVHSNNRKRDGAQTARRTRGRGGRRARAGRSGGHAAAGARARGACARAGGGGRAGGRRTARPAPGPRWRTRRGATRETRRVQVRAVTARGCLEGAGRHVIPTWNMGSYIFRFFLMVVDLIKSIPWLIPTLILAEIPP